MFPLKSERFDFFIFFFHLVLLVAINEQSDVTTFTATGHQGSVSNTLISRVNYVLKSVDPRNVLPFYEAANRGQQSPTSLWAR